MAVETTKFKGEPRVEAGGIAKTEEKKLFQFAEGMRQVNGLTYW